MNAVLSEDLAELLDGLGEDRLAIIYMPANEDGLPELAAARDALPPSVLAHFMGEADLDDMVMGQLGFEDGQLVFWVNNAEHPSFAEHLEGVFAQAVPALVGAEIRAEEGGSYADEDEADEEYEPEADEEAEPEVEESEPEEEAPAPAPVPVPVAMPKPPAVRPLSERLTEALRAHPPVAAALDALGQAKAALDDARRPLLGALSALELHRRRFAEAVALVRTNTSVGGMKEAQKLLPPLVAAERVSAPNRSLLVPRLAAVAAAATRAEGGAREASAQDPALAEVIAEAGTAVPWGGTSAAPIADLTQATAAVAAVASRAPAIRDAARRYRSVAQSKSWGEVVPDSLRDEVAPLRAAVYAGLRLPNATPPRELIEGSLNVLSDALGAARHARQWADRLPPDHRAVAEASQQHVAEEAATWLELAWLLGGVG